MNIQTATVPGYGVFKCLGNDSIIGREILAGRVWEPYMHPMFAQAVATRPWTDILDIGANIGCHTVALAKMAPSCQVHAFEPMGVHHMLLQENITGNNLKNVKAYNVGLGEKEMTMFEPNLDWKAEDNFGGHGLVYEGDSQKEIQVKPLDSYDWRRPISFMKIDVEGHELKVLEGAMGTIAKWKPTMIIEIWDHVYINEFLQSKQAKQLQDMGYTHQKVSTMDYLFTV